MCANVAKRNPDREANEARVSRLLRTFEPAPRIGNTAEQVFLMDRRRRGARRTVGPRVYEAKRWNGEAGHGGVRRTEFSSEIDEKRRG
ncbi:hypothetical protein U1Q18_049964 [Sarracenia purpurea var. burkii]